ncbi:unnamed protein product [Effrenium voratum]|uniref:Uncharacterized protein n=1 Tax=Effrenium voratum TaxID=2562239 RepID=A0AA36MIU6_9DINO|nr:unnamed protein product [Effrenium voratum]
MSSGQWWDESWRAPRRGPAWDRRQEGFQRRQDERMEQVRQIASLTEQVAQQNADIHAMATELTVGRLKIAELQKELDKANTPKRARKELDKVPQADTSNKTRKEK